MITTMNKKNQDNIPYPWTAPKKWERGAWEYHVRQKPKYSRFVELLVNTHVRCIHLPHRIDREMIMFEAFRRLGIADRQDLFFNAIDGNKSPVPNPGMRPGNWGCALSKSVIMAEAVAQNKPLLLLEDDVVINPQIHTIMDNCLSELPEDWRVLYLGCAAIEPHDTMPTKGQPVRQVKGKWHEILANPNLNHAVLIRDVSCLKELSEILADPETYRREEGRWTSDYTMAQYFAHKGIPMYGVVPIVAEQCGSYSDNVQEVVKRNAVFKPMPPIQNKWGLTGTTEFPIEWGIESFLPEYLQDKGYIAAKIHPPFDLTLQLYSKAEVTFALLTTSQIKDNEKVEIYVSEMETGISLPEQRQMVLGKGEYKITCNPEGETWRWKHVAILVKEL